MQLYVKNRIAILLSARNVSIICIIFLLQFFLQAVQVSASQQKQKVLFINSYHYGFEWSDSLVDATLQELHAHTQNIEFCVEYMDTKRTVGKESTDAFATLLRQKYTKNPPDVIIASDDNAYQFLLSHRLALFPNIPIVFIGVNNYKPSQLLGHEHFVTGFIQKTDIFETASVALTQNPKANRIVFIHDGSPTGKGDAAEFKRTLPQLKELFPTLEVAYITGDTFSTEEMLNQVADIPPSSVALLSIWTSGQDQKLIPYLKSFELISTKCSVPLYSPAGPGLKHGIIGGKVTTGPPHGKAAARMALQILAGTSVADIPVVTDSVNQYQFDYQQLKRWKIDMKNLPAEYKLINRPPTAFETYGHILFPLIGFALFQSFFIILLFANIRKRKLVEEELTKVNETLQENEERLELALTGANDGVWDWHIQQNSFQFDKRYYTMAGYTQDEFPASFEEWKKRVHPDDLGRTQEAIEQHLAGESAEFSVEFRFLRKDNTYMWVRGKGSVVSHDKDGKPLRFIGTHSDITAQKQAERRYQKSEKEYRQLYRQAPVMLHNLDTEGRITEINEQWIQTMGYTREEVLGRRSMEFLTEESKEAATKLFPTLYEQNLLQNISYQFVSKNGDILDILLSAYMFRDDDGTVLGIRGALIDVTESNRIKKENEELETQLRHAQKMEAIGTLAGGIAHDFNNMLGGIMGATELLGFYLPDNNPKAMKMHQTILDAAIRASDLTKQLLAFSRQSTNISSTVDLHAIIQETLTLVKSTVDRRVVIDVDLNAEKSSVVGDPSLLQNSLLNLCINAAHSMPKGGKIWIRSESIVIDESFCTSSTFDIEPGPYIEVEIRDEGTGIPEKHIEKIFDPFFTTKEKGQGTGLGLSSVYGVVQQHKGTIDVSSELGVGTAFRLLMPISQKENSLCKNSDEIKRGSGHILVVDDEEVMRATAKALLEELGYDVTLAVNGQEAIDYVADEKQRVDLILLDMVMPIMNGRDCFDLLKKQRPELKVILSSGFSREEDIAEMKLRGLNGFIRKPYLSVPLSRIIFDTLYDKR